MLWRRDVFVVFLVIDFFNLDKVAKIPLLNWLHTEINKVDAYSFQDFLKNKEYKHSKKRDELIIKKTMEYLKLEFTGNYTKKEFERYIKKELKDELPTAEEDFDRYLNRIHGIPEGNRRFYEPKEESE